MPRLAMPTSRDQRSAPPTPAREIARIAVPVSMEFVLMLVLNFVNQIVVGSLGATAIAAVGFSNSLTFILAVTLGCLGTSVSILVARAHGAGRRDALDHTVTTIFHHRIDYPGFDFEPERSKRRPTEVPAPPSAVAAADARRTGPRPI